MRYRASITETEELSEINISPLIDMVFILLIFFIVTTVFVEESGVEVDKPEAASAVNLEKNSILLALTGKGQVFYGGDPIAPGAIRPLVRRLLSGDDMPVILQVDKEANASLIVRVIDEAKLGGAKKISLSAGKPGT